MVALPKRFPEPNVKFNSRKFKEAIIYIARKSENDERFGAVKLNKILFYADFSAYRELGRALTGANYQHLDEGPAPHQLVPVREDMIQNGDIKPINSPYYGKKQKRIMALREPDNSVFSSQELKYLDHEIKRLWDMNAEDVKTESHKEFGYKLTEDNEIIPYAFSYLLSRPITQSEIDVGLKVAKRHKFG